jgi:hypothetical protein
MSKYLVVSLVFICGCVMCFMTNTWRGAMCDNWLQDWLYKGIENIYAEE